MPLGHRQQAIPTDVVRWADPNSGWNLDRNEAEKKMCRIAVKEGSEALIDLGKIIIGRAFQDPERSVGDVEMVSSEPRCTPGWHSDSSTDHTFCGGGSQCSVRALNMILSAPYHDDDGEFFGKPVMQGLQVLPTSPSYQQEGIQTCLQAGAFVTAQDTVRAALQNLLIPGKETTKVLVKMTKMKDFVGLSKHRLVCVCVCVFCVWTGAGCCVSTLVGRHRLI